jgi:hypothetical protein
MTEIISLTPQMMVVLGLMGRVAVFILHIAGTAERRILSILTQLISFAYTPVQRACNGSRWLPGERLYKGGRINDCDLPCRYTGHA